MQISKKFSTLAGLDPSEIYVETGTFEGENLSRIVLSQSFYRIISIELDPKWYEYNSKRFSDLPSIELIHSDSPSGLRRIKFRTGNRVTFFLDAHYSGPGTAKGELENPLLEELRVITTLLPTLDRDSVICIDDIRLLGKAEKVLGNGVNYLPFFADWTGITLEEIKKILPKGTRYITNKNKWVTSGKSDQLVCFRSSNLRMVLILMMDFSMSILNFALGDKFGRS